MASIPGMGIPEQMKAAMEQEHSSKSQPSVSQLMNITPTQLASNHKHTATFPLRKSQQKSEEMKAWFCCEDKHRNHAFASEGLEG